MSNRRFSFFPKALDQCVEPLTRPLFKAQGLAGSRIVSEWESIVGPQLARHTLPEKLSFPKNGKTNGTLVISTENGFATELQHRQPQILERLAGYFGYQAITRIVISHSWTEPPPSVKLIPLPPRIGKDSVKIADHVSDPELKAALQSLAKTMSGQKP